MACKSRCHLVPGADPTRKQVRENEKKCSSCDMLFTIDHGVRCLCCGRILRTSMRRSGLRNINKARM